MKSKKLLLVILFIIGSNLALPVFAQDCDINILGLQPSILNYEEGIVEVVICNVDANNVTAPVNKLRPQISFPNNLTLLSVTNPDGSDLTNFTIQQFSNETGNHTVRLLNNTPLPNAECFTFYIHVEGNAVGTGVVTATLGFQGPQTPGNLTANDNSTTSVPVEINLPVKLKEFRAAKEGNITNLTWSTTEEINSDRFDVERSKNGKQWETIQKVTAAGGSVGEKSYSAVDAEPLNGDNLYRLHMIDKDGSSAYSKIESVRFDLKTDFTMFPNPLSDQLNIKTAEDWSKVQKVRIYNMQGKEVYESGEKPVKTIDLKHLAAGTYVVKVRLKNNTSSDHKIVIAK